MLLVAITTGQERWKARATLKDNTYHYQINEPVVPYISLKKNYLSRLKVVAVVETLGNTIIFYLYTKTKHIACYLPKTATWEPAMASMYS